MKTVGIIAEYNPFHTGHEYHIKKAKEAAKADYAIVVMSPDFVQRGEPAVFDKYTRTRMALLAGADLVIELPLCYATGSAEYFAEGAIAMLDFLGVTDALCFGSESTNVNLFLNTAKILLNEPEDYKQILREELRTGRNYPQARSAALGKYMITIKSLSSDHVHQEEEAISDFLATPNNILGIEYCKALLKRSSRMTPLPIKRQGNGYHSNDLAGDFCSATAIRQWITGAMRPDTVSQTDTSLSKFSRNCPDSLMGCLPTNCPDSLLDCLPTNCPDSLLDCLPTNCPDSLMDYIPKGIQEVFCSSIRTVLTCEDFLPYLNQKLLSGRTFDSILDISSDLSDRIQSQRFKCIGKTYAEIVALLKTKQVTEARIRRALLHLILDIQSDTVEVFRQNGSVFYARVLGFRKTASPLLHQIKHETKIPLVVKTAAAEKEFAASKNFFVPDTQKKAADNKIFFVPDTQKKAADNKIFFDSDTQKKAANTETAVASIAENKHTTIAQKMWQQDLYASHLYRSVLASRYGTVFKTEYECSPIIL